MLVVVRLPLARRAADFSVKEKDEARFLKLFFRKSLNAFIPRLPEPEGFFISGSALVSQSKTPFRHSWRDTLERSVVCCKTI